MLSNGLERFLKMILGWFMPTIHLRPYNTILLYCMQVYAILILHNDTPVATKYKNIIWENF